MIPISNLFNNNSKLIITEAVPVDDQFSNPRQCNWSAALGMVLVADYSNQRGLFRFPNLLFSSKRILGGYPFVIDSDTQNIYISGSVALYKESLSLNGAFAKSTSCAIASPRMIDAANLTTHVLVTSNNGTDHHGLRLVRKSDMTVPAGLSLLADGSGNGQFNNPLGIKYYGGKAYVCDYDNSRIQVIAIDLVTPALTYDSQVALAYKPMDLCTDGVNWYVLSATYLYKYDMSFTDATKVSASLGSGKYSLCIIPDQGDGNGQTLCIVDNANSHIERRKCSGLTRVSAIGSSGDGSASLFDPTFTTSVTTTITFRRKNDGWTYTTPAGTSHALSMNGFAAAFRNWSGNAIWEIKCAAGLGAITAFDGNTDAITSIKNVKKCINCTSIKIHQNTSLVWDISEVSPQTTTLWLTNDANVSGNVAILSGVAKVSIYCNGTKVSGSITGINISSEMQFAGTTVTGSVSDFPNCPYIHMYGCTGITAASIAHLVAIRDLRIYNMGWIKLA